METDRERLIRMGEVLKEMRKELGGEVIISFEVREADHDTIIDWFKVNVKNVFHEAYGTGLNLYDAAYMAEVNLRNAAREVEDLNSQIVEVKILPIKTEKLPTIKRPLVFRKPS